MKLRRFCKRHWCTRHV